MGPLIDTMSNAMNRLGPLKWVLVSFFEVAFSLLDWLTGDARIKLREW
jgi:hypothetical protein